MSIHKWSSIGAGSFGKCTEETPFHFSCVPTALGTVMMTAVRVKKKLMQNLMCIFTPNHDLDQLLPETLKNKQINSYTQVICVIASS